MGGCLQIQPTKQEQTLKSFEEEDKFIMYGLDAEVRQKYVDAARYYDLLYDKTANKEYQYRSINMRMKQGSYDEVVAVTTKELLLHDDVKLMRFKIAALIELKKLEEAKVLALHLVEMTKEEGDYIIVSDIYHREKNYEMSLKYLESAYAINYDEQILDTLAVTLYVNLDRQDEAISYLETHNRLHGCSDIVCSRLAGFYSNQNNIDGMLSIYLRMYEQNQNEHVGEAIVNIYNYQKNYPKLMLFLEKYGFNDELLLRMYVSQKKYGEAATLAKKIYKESGESFYLGQGAIFTYETSENHSDPKILRSVVRDLKSAILQNEDALFLNYLGYLMIDHDVDVEGGIEYVNRALKISPESVYYLDSLAWGYYKLNRCSEAYELIKKVEASLGRDDNEVKAHIQAIEKCLKEKK
jgi:tetratricopeptide (TPR) repeat protein